MANEQIYFKKNTIFVTLLKHLKTMEKIQDIYLYELSYAENLGLLNQVAEFCDELTTPDVQSHIAQFKEQLQAYFDAFGQDRKNPHTERVNKCDQCTCNAWRHLRAYSKAMCHWPEPQLADLSKQVYQAVIYYGNIVAVGQGARYANVNGMLDTLGDMQAQHSSLMAHTFVPWMEELQKCYDAYLVANDDQLSVDSTYQVGLARTTRKQANDAYNALIYMVNAVTYINGDADYLTFIRYVNVLIDDYQQTLSARRTRSRNKKKQNQA